MDTLFSKFTEQWAVVSSAPYPFALAIFIASGAIWFVVQLIYGTRFENKNAEIALLKERISAYEDKLKGATPEQAAGLVRSLTTQLNGTHGRLADLEKELDAIKSPPRDPDGLYQHGHLVGKVTGAHKDIGNGVVRFAAIYGNGDFAEGAEFEFHDLILKIVQRTSSATISGMGRVDQRQFAQVSCKIIRRI